MPTQFYNPKDVHQPTVYSHMVTVTSGTLLFLAGQVAFDKDRNLVGAGDIVVQTEQACQNIQAILHEVDATFHDVVKMTIYIVGLDDDKRDKAINVIQRYMNSENPPTNTLLGIQSLARSGLLIEIEVVAHIS